MSNESKPFSFSYSGAISDELEQIKEKYTPTKVNEKTKRVRSLDKRVDFSSTMLSICIGLFGTALLISGVIYIIAFHSSPLLGILQSTVGIAVNAAVPFIHAKVLAAARRHYGPKILALIKEIEQNQL